MKQRRRQLTARLMPPLVWGLIRLIWKTCRIEAVLGEQHMHALRAERTPFIPCYWHQQQIFCVRYLLDQAAMDPDLKLGYLISPSRDGDMATRMFSSQGVHIIRGSATRGGAQALRDIYLQIRKEGVSPIVTPDGPTGPIYKTKAGVAMLAQLSKAPLLPLAYQASSVWYLRSWDRFMLPRPFSRIVIALEEPMHIGRDDAADDFQSACQRFDQRLEQASAACQRYLRDKQ
ncbi:lysophospholipid acyltransferase family protein [Granulosicoccus sp. 3-233]|uniref:lysophospholipid acyltransferase family protein n=1 Tax=Granulosicoccus sp. 3-233 TaxID=3417969 RepID=UPI003D3487A2